VVEQNGFISGPFDVLTSVSVGITIKRICSDLQRRCQASNNVIDLCEGPAYDAAIHQPSVLKQADTFNAIFGVQTNFAAIKKPKQ
jgi:hypothetical protein